MNYGYNMIARLELPDSLQSGDHIIGIRKSSNNAPNILRRTQDLMREYGKNIYFDEFWTQSKTYVRHRSKNNMIDSFKPASKSDYDDILDGSTYGYIAALCSQSEPKNLKNDVQFETPERRLVVKGDTLVYETPRKNYRRNL